MRNSMKKMVSLVLVGVCLMGTVSFADNNEYQQYDSQVEQLSALEKIGGIPEYIQGPDREDLEAMLVEIDVLEAQGQDEIAEAVWQQVNDMILLYAEMNGVNLEEQEPVETDEDRINDYIEALNNRIERFENAGDFERADQARAELEKFLQETFGMEDPDMQEENHANPEDIDQIIAETEAKIQMLLDSGRLEEAEALRAELEGFLNNLFNQDHAMSPEDDFFNMLQAMEEEANRLQDAGLFNEADELRAEIERMINNSENHDPDFSPENHDDFYRMIEEMEAEAQRLDAEGNHEAADQVRAEIEELISNTENHEPCFEPDMNDEFFPQDQPSPEELEEEIERLEAEGMYHEADRLREELENMYHEDIIECPENEDVFVGPEVISLEEILNKLNMDITPNQLEVLMYLMGDYQF